MTHPRPRVLFVTWDGPAQNYLSSLFFPIFEAAARDRFDVDVLQFGWEYGDLRDTIARDAAGAGIHYVYREVPRRLKHLATAAAIVDGAAAIRSHVREREVDLLFPRAIIPGAMTLVAARLGVDLPVCFDCDGFFADERAEFGGWSPHGVTYRLFRDVEAEVARRAGATIVRTEHARDVLRARVGATARPGPIFAIANGKDDARYTPGPAAERDQTRARAGVGANAPWLLYAGSLGPHYHPQAMLRFFAAVRARRPDARFTILTGNQDVAEAAMAETGVREGVDVRRVPPLDVPRYAAAADLGLAFREPSFSQRAVSPVKVSEYLLCGLPTLSTAGIGDLDLDVERGLPGLRLIDDLDPETLLEAARRLVEDDLQKRDALRAEIRAGAVSRFGMAACAAATREAWETALSAKRNGGAR